MTPGARVQTAIELLDDILNGTPAEKALTGWARRSRFAGSKDRAAVRDHVFDALRRRNSASAAGGGLSGRGLMIGVLRQDQSALDALFTGVGYAPAPLSREEQHIAQSDTCRPDVPEWLIGPIRDTLGADAEHSLQLLRERAPVALRVNLQRVNRDAAQASLRADEIVTRQTDLAATGLLVTQGARRVSQSAAYKGGMVELQDISSQIAVETLPLRDDMSVLDYCAGGGGKLLAMAGQARARFFAHDANPQRLRDLPERARRAGVKFVQTTQPDDHAPYDLVFCDVPCSGSGTWRRAPDAKWRFMPEDLTRLAEVQQRILRQASTMVAGEGTLVYATCSILNVENQHQIDRFIADAPGWNLVQTRQLPITQDNDGFFFAQLKREL